MKIFDEVTLCLKIIYLEPELNGILMPLTKFYYAYGLIL